MVSPHSDAVCGHHALRLPARNHLSHNDGVAQAGSSGHMQRYKNFMTLAIKSLSLFELICDYPYIDRKSVSRCRNTPSSSTAKNLHRKCHKQATHPLYRIDIFSMSAMLITLLHSFLRFSGFDERRKSHNAQIGVLPQSDCKITKFSLKSTVTYIVIVLY